VFNDVDTAPYKPDLVDFRTTHGVVKHFYGFDFAFGGIVPGEVHPTFNKLVGPSYAVNFLEEPKKNTINEPQENYVSKVYNTPKIPFKGTDGKQLTTYNIWTIEGSSQAVKYYGPKATGNSPSIRTVQETELGPCVEVSSKNADTTVKRLFPIC
jgi:hypothetical protein